MLTIRTEIAKVETMADKGNKVVLYTPEMTPRERAELFDMQGEGIVMVGMCKEERDLNEENLKVLGKPPEGKSQSQKLRNTIYVLWETIGSKKDFDTFYNEAMESIINRVKEKINNPVNHA